MIKINDNYYIKFEPMNIVLCQKKIHKRTTKRYKEGDLYLEAIAYFGTMEHLINHILNNHFINSKDKDFTDIQDLIESINNFKIEIINKMKEVLTDYEK